MLHRTVLPLLLACAFGFGSIVVGGCDLIRKEKKSASDDDEDERDKDEEDEDDDKDKDKKKKKKSSKKNDDDEDDGDDEKKPTSLATASAQIAAPAVGESTGISECDAFLARNAACAFMPPEQIAQLRASFRQAGSVPAARDSIVQSCRDSLAALASAPCAGAAGGAITAAGARVVECPSAPQVSNATVTTALAAIGWQKTGTMTYCAGDMVNFSCQGPGGTGITVQSQGREGNVVPIRFGSPAAASAYQEKGAGVTLAVGGNAVLRIELPAADADQLVARVCGKS